MGTGATHGVGWEKLPGWAAIVVSCLFLFIMACAEGLQVSALALQRTPTEEFRNTGAKAVLVTGDDWGMGAGFNEWCLQTGFMGAVFVVNVAQLASQVAASIFPIRLINNWIMYFLLQAMLITEASGFVNACYPIMWFMDRMFAMKEDPLHFEAPANASEPPANAKASDPVPTAAG